MTVDIPSERAVDILMQISHMLASLSYREFCSGSIVLRARRAHSAVASEKPKSNVRIQKNNHSGMYSLKSSRGSLKSSDMKRMRSFSLPKRGLIS